MPVALLFHPVLENHGDAEDEDEVNSNNTKGCGEDLVKVSVGERREWTNASTFLGRDKRVGACRILDKRRCGSVDVSAAIELGLLAFPRTVLSVCSSLPFAATETGFAVSHVPKVHSSFGVSVVSPPRWQHPS